MSLFSAPTPEPDPPPKKREPFDPSKMAKPADPPPTAAEPFRVSDIAARIDAALKQGLPAKVRVRGEITGLSDRTHWYFSLKDADAVLGCVMFASAASRVQFQAENGMEVIATGSISHFAKWGKTQLYVTKLEPVGAGALELRFQKLVADLRARGMFDDARKQPIPLVPRKIAVVTSKTGAALQDVIDTLRRRAPFVEILTIDVRVQGDHAAPEIVSALDMLNRRAQDLCIDTIILTRGGGSREDLWAFNEPEVAEAIAQSKLPIVAAIGHETDTSIAELVADLRAATPTQAALRAAPDAAALGEQLDATAARIRSALTRRAQRASDRLDAHRAALTSAQRAALHHRTDSLHRLTARLSRRRPAAVYAQRRTTLTELSDRLVRTANRAIAAKSPAAISDRLKSVAAGRARVERAHLAELERLLQSTGPVATLRRGYSVTTAADGSLLRSAADARAGTEIVTRLADGSVRSTVSGGKRRKRLSKNDDAGPTLFGEE